MVEEILLSIIIPVYNSEKYLEACLYSLISQITENIEIIIINDGSTDNSKQIIEKYVSKNILYFEQSNKGVSAARNYGIQMARGKYIYFCDSDDIVDCNLIELFNELKNIEFDICGFKYNTFINKYESASFSKKYKFVNKVDFIKKVITDYHTLGYLWNKIFKLSIIKNNQIRFDETIRVREDELFVLQYAKYVDTIILTDNVLYHYRNNPNSVINEDNRMKHISSLKASEHILKLLLDFNLKDEAYLVWNNLINSYFSYAIHCHKELKFDGLCDLDNRYRSIKNYYKTKSFKTRIKELMYCMIIKISKLKHNIGGGIKQQVFVSITHSRISLLMEEC